MRRVTTLLDGQLDTHNVYAVLVLLGAKLPNPDTAPPIVALAAELVQLKKQPETAFLKECHSQVLQQTLMDLDKAFVAFFDKPDHYNYPHTAQSHPAHRPFSYRRQSRASHRHYQL